MLKRFKDQPVIRPLLDEIADPPCIVLKHLDDNLLAASNKKQSEKAEIKLVARKVLEALVPLHEAGYVHTGKIPDLNFPRIGLMKVYHSRYQAGQYPRQLRRQNESFQRNHVGRLWRYLPHPIPSCIQCPINGRPR